jgi:hypothetical protein
MDTFTVQLAHNTPISFCRWEPGPGKQVAQGRAGRNSQGSQSNRQMCWPEGTQERGHQVAMQALIVLSTRAQTCLHMQVAEMSLQPHFMCTLCLPSRRCYEAAINQV